MPTNPDELRDWFKTRETNNHDGGRPISGDLFGFLASATSEGGIGFESAVVALADAVESLERRLNEPQRQG